MAFLKILHKNKNKASLYSDTFDIIREHFSQEKAGMFRAKRSYFATPREYAITPLGTFDIGLSKEIIKFALSQGIPTEVEIDDKVKSILKPSLNFTEVLEVPNETYKLRSYQSEAIKLAIPHGRGTILLPTGTGKTLAMAALIRSILLRNKISGYILVLVPDIGLVSQTYDDFIKYGLENKISKWSGSNEFNPSSEIIICNHSIIRQWNQSKIAQKLANETSLLFIDEVHTIKKGNKITKIIDAFKTNNRFGFTATMPEDLIDQWTILGKIGPIIMEMEAHEAREAKYIADVEAKAIILKHKAPPQIKVNPDEPHEAYHAELDWLSTCQFRNKFIINFANKMKYNSLLLVNRLEHGRALLEMARQLDVSKKIYFIEGNVEVEDREIVKKIMEENDNVICVAMSSIFSTGISINNLHYIFFCAGGKSLVRIVQAIGRSSRLHPNKEKTVIFDIADNTRYSLKHLTKRLALYDKEKIKYEKVHITET